MANLGKIYGSEKLDNSVIAYTADNVLQHKMITLDSGIATDLIVGSVIDVTTGALATSTGNVGVLLSPAFAGQNALRIARAPFSVLIKESLIVDSSITLDAVVTALTSQDFAFTDYDKVALRTT